MGLGLILFILVLLVFLTAFIVFLVKSARQWGALHIVLLSFLFIESWVFLYFTAGVQHERVRATRDAHRFREEAEEAIARGNRLRFGSVDAPYDSLEAIIPVQGQLERLSIDRGRVWRQLSLINRTENRIDLSLQSAAPDLDLDEPGAPAVQLAVGASLPEDLVVYAFDEQLDEQGYPLPVFYLGEFRVVSSDADSGEVTLESTLPMLAIHQTRIDEGAENWTLYEMLPIDSHVAFSAPGSEPTDEAIFGRPEEDEIRRLLDGAPEAVISSYLRNGQAALEEDRPETIWEHLNLLTEYEIDVDSDQSADATISGYFDQVGRSIDIRLKRDERVSLNPAELRDNRIVVTQAVARDLIDRGIAERVQQIFVRPLNDYLGLFNRYFSQSFDLDERIKYYQYQNELIDQANQNGQQLVAYRQKENQLLTEDLSNFQREVQFLSEANEEGSQSVQTFKRRLSRLYRALQEHHQQLMLSGARG